MRSGGMSSVGCSGYVRMRESFNAAMAGGCVIVADWGGAGGRIGGRPRGNRGGNAARSGGRQCSASLCGRRGHTAQSTVGIEPSSRSRLPLWIWPTGA